MVTSKKRLVRLPAQPNIVTLLEIFVRNYAIHRLVQLEKQLVKPPSYGSKKISLDKELELYEGAVSQINICKEVADGVRIITDFHLGKLLLYPGEREQYSQSTSLRPHMENIERQVAGDLLEKPTNKTTRNSASSRNRQQSETGGEGEGGGGTPAASVASRKRRSTARTGEMEVPGSVGSTSSGTATPTQPPTRYTQYPQTHKSHSILQEQVYNWKLVPESLYFEEPVSTSLVYGGVHLTRLLVRLPDLLFKMRFSVKTSKHLLKYLEFLVEFLSNQQDIFTDSNYEDK